jgi:hypothetical protein
LLSILMALAATQAQPATTAPAATPPAAAPATAAPAAGARTLQNLPGATIQYYDVPGRNSAAVEKNLKQLIAAPAPKNTAARVYDWDLGMSIKRRTEGTACTIVEATPTLKGTVYLPRLTPEAKMQPQELASWNAYVAGIEKMAADNLWFVADRVPTVGQPLIGKPCDQASTLWNAAVDDLVKQQQAYAATLRAAKAAATPAKGKAKSRGNEGNAATSTDDNSGY